MLKNTMEGYGLITRLFHWIMVLLVAGTIIDGDMAADMISGPDKTAMIGMHKSFGFLILVLAVFRLVWRLINLSPKDLGEHPFQNKLGHAMHILLYILLLLQPLSGILMSQAFGYPVRFFGLFMLPVLIHENMPLGKVLLETHETAWVILAAAVGIHAAAALKHHFIEKNRTLMRMIVGK
jgi:cytochrome b561